MPQILVTGAAGLLGAELLRQFSDQSVRVRAVDRQPIPAGLNQAHDCLTGDLRDEAHCRAACEGADTIIHTAAVQYHDRVPRWSRDRFFAANIEMTRRLTAAAVLAGVRRFIYVSSDMVYGLPPGRPLTETDPTHPLGPYGRSKLAGEQLVHTAAKDHNLRATILRPRLIVGPGRLGVLRKLFDALRANRRVPVFGSGKHRYQMVAVADVASACRLALDRDIAGVFNLGSTDPPTVNALLTDLAGRIGSRSRLIHLPNALTCAALAALDAINLAPLKPEQFRIAGVDYVLDTAAARRDLGWNPAHSDADMLWQAYAAYTCQPTTQAASQAPLPPAAASSPQNKPTAPSPHQ